ncbi:MAG: electron transport complex subunit E [Candidatus Rokubacteria bacterium]|nr:electron transport complex subunit E [Candidatus Rokubacteria bacterium]MBI3106279.1 electron transport complex subunit E [Candidatus Rokubacteria bacterium]
MPAELHCGAHGATPRGFRRATTPAEDLLRGVWRENPVLVQLLGLCPTLAVTNSVANSIVMGLATFFVLLGSSFLVSTVKRFVPHAVRISTYILIIATFVTVAEMVLQALVPDIHKALGPFVALIVVNCIILGRQEAFASRQPVGRAVLDAVGMGSGFMIALLLMGSVREVLGSGTFLGMSLFGPGYEPWVIMVLPPGGFFTLGFLLLAINWLKRARVAQAPARERSRSVTATRAA